MADTDYLHTAEILRAAMPNVTNHIRPMLTMFASMMEMLGSMNIMKEPDLRVQSLNEEPMDAEALLTGIRQACNEKEQQFVDQILNFFHMKKMIKTYQDMMQVMEMMQGTNDNSSPQNTTSNNTETMAPQQNIYDNRKSAYAMHTRSVPDSDSTFFDADITKESHEDFTNEDSSFYHSRSDDGFVNQSLKVASVETEQNKTPNMIFGNQPSGYSSKSTKEDYVQSSNNNPFQTNPQMINMLKSMLPAEQAEMVDNISMLFHNQHS